MLMFENPVANDTQYNRQSKKDNSPSQEALNDYWICCISRETSLLARKEVLSGKAKFGITGDGKEVPQIAMAKAMRKGDWRAGYYRDQTLMFALGISTVEEFFAQLYSDSANDPFSGGRQMNAHFATANHLPNGEWNDHSNQFNISSDVSCTGGQMGRAVGLALASKKFRENPSLNANFSENGNELCICTIGDASTSEGVFWEAINAAGVMKIPLAVSIWDDGYGISVSKKYQTTKESISEILEGFRVNEKGQGIELYKAKGWDYPTLCKLYKTGFDKMRKTHIPAVFHIEDLTQPQGHSTSGSHERYKDKDRLNWEKEHDCNKKMREWMIKSKVASSKQLDDLEAKAKDFVKEAKNKAWQAYSKPVQRNFKTLDEIYNRLYIASNSSKKVEEIHSNLKKLHTPVTTELLQNARRMSFQLIGEDAALLKELRNWISKIEEEGALNYNTELYSSTPKSALNIPVIAPIIKEDSIQKNGYEILNLFFDKALEKYNNFFAFGEDVGQIGDVNQGFAGLQNKFGENRVFDTGIREWTIVGQAIGMAMRGLRPLAEIQYLDYVIYGLEPLSDDLASLRYRTNGIQRAPAIIRTRGHRLEGIWHAGSPMSMLVSSLRGMYICVPRNMVQAAGFYNTLLQSDDPAMVIESLNSYRKKEKLPENLGTYTVPLGIPEVLREGKDVTLVTYGSCIHQAEEAIDLLANHGISVELIDIQTLLPFDINHSIVESIKKTSKVVFLDEDVPGGGTAYMMQEVLEKQNAYRYLDGPPKTISAKAHRPPYGSDGDYFTKPNPEDIFKTIYNLMRDSNPEKYPEI